MTIRELLIKIGFNVDKSGVGQADAAMGGLEKRASSLGSAVGALGAAFGMAFAVREVFQMADAWANVEGRIGLVTKGAEDQSQAFDKVYELSNKTRQLFDTTGDLFYKLSNASHEFGASQEDVLRVTETVNKALVAGGASTSESKATVLQLGQALASGRLQGDELRSLDENASNLMREVAKNFGVTIGELKKMGAEGKLTSKEVFEAIKKSSAVIDAQFEKMPTTIGQATTVSMNIVGKFFRDIEKETGVFKGIAGGVVWVFTNIDKGIRGIASSVGGFKNLIKLLGLTIMGLGVAFAWLKWDAIVGGILKARKAMWLFLTTPATWVFIAMAAAVVLVALALEDLYYWITGGNSVLGKYLGSWEDFKTKVTTWITNMKDTFFNFLNGMLTSFAQWSSSFLTGFAQWCSLMLTLFAQLVVSMITGFIDLMVGIYTIAMQYFNMVYDVFVFIFTAIINHFMLVAQLFMQIITGDFAGAFDTLGAMWENMKNSAVTAFNTIMQYAGNLLSFLTPIAQTIGKIMGFNLGNINMSTFSNLDIAGSGGKSNGVNVTVNQELPPGTPAQQASFVQDATQEAADSMFRATLYTEYAT